MLGVGIGWEGDAVGVKRKPGRVLPAKSAGVGSLGGGIAWDGDGKGLGTTMVGEGPASEKGFTVDTRKGRLRGNPGELGTVGDTKLPNKLGPAERDGSEPNAAGGKE